MSGNLPMKETELGLWGVSSIEDVRDIFKRLKIKGSFLDLGSGDGKVCAIASLFCDNVKGIECDKELIDKSKEFQSELQYSAEFIHGDYLKHDLSKYDWIFLNPDQELFKLEKKLNTELNGKIIVYSNIYFFKDLRLETEFEINSIKVKVYSA